MKKFTLVLAVICMLAMATGAMAGQNVNWSAGDVSLTNLGSDGTQPGNYDRVSLDGGTGVLDLTPGISQLVDIGMLTFEVNYNRLVNQFFPNIDLPFVMIVNGITRSLVIPMSLDIAAADTLTVGDGLTTFLFGNVSVTPLQWGPITQGVGGVYSAQLQANFEAPAVPEPMSMALGFMGLSTLAGYAKLRRRKA